MLESQFGYKPSKKAKPRRKALKKAIQETSFDTVYDLLERRKENVEGYKHDRIEWDLSFLEKRSDRYYTSKNFKSNSQHQKSQAVTQ